jgi:hypothetical protein
MRIPLVKITSKLRLAAVALILLVAAIAGAQTPVSGTFTQSSVPVANGIVAFSLQNCGQNPTAGSATYSFTLNSSGVLTGAVQGNAGNGCVQVSGTNVSYFQVTLSNSSNQMIWRRYFQVPVQTGAWNLSTATPLSSLPATIAQASSGVNSVNGKTGSAVTLTANDVGALPSTGGSVTGPIALPADPVANLQAATKQYVDSHSNKCNSSVVQAAPGAYVVGTSVSTTFPGNTLAGDLLYVVADTVGLSGSSYSGFTGIHDTQGNTFVLIASLAWSVFDKPHDIWVASNIIGGPDTIYVTASGSTPSINVDAVEYSGLTLTSPVDVTAAGWVAGTPGTVNGINIKQPGERLVLTLFQTGSASATGYTADAAYSSVFATLSSTATLAGPQSVTATYTPQGNGGAWTQYTAFACPAGTSTPSLNWRGVWSSTPTYSTFDMVSYNYSSYVALQPGTNQEPDTATAYWGQVSKAGGVPIVVVPLVATPVFNGNQGDSFKITLTGSPNVTSSTLTNTANLSTVRFEIVQDSTGGHPFVWPTNVHNPGTVSSTASSHSTQIFMVDPADGSLYPLSSMQVN